jgi:phosphohistidine phosphatase
MEEQAMRLYLVQHGDAVWKQVDPDRPLSPTGRGEVARVARFLAAAQVRCTRVFHSGKTRARQTAEILAAAVAPNGRIERFLGIDPNDSTDDLAHAIAQWDEDTLVVGHLPFMSRCVARLLGGRETRDLVAFRPGSLVCLERTDDGDWVVAWMIRPELVAE